MQAISYHSSSCNDAKAIAPVVYQTTKTIGVGSGIDEDTFLSIAQGGCAAYGGQITNHGCYDLKLVVKFMQGSDCDSCTSDTYELTDINLIVPAGSTFPLPDAFWSYIGYQTVDDTGAAVSNTSAVKVDLYSAYVPSCNGCIEAIAVPPCGGSGDTGQVTVANQPGVNGTYKKLDLLGMSVTGANIWIWALDNNMDLKVNGVQFTSAQQLNFFSGTSGAYAGGVDCKFADGTWLGGGSPWSYPANAAEPQVKINISSTGVVSFLGRKSAGVYEQMVLTNGATWKVVPVFVGCNDINTYEFSQSTQFNPTGATLRIFGL